jgi:hypothetical protein
VSPIFSQFFGKFHAPANSLPGKENAGKENMLCLLCIFLSDIFLSGKLLATFGGT